MLTVFLVSLFSFCLPIHVCHPCVPSSHPCAFHIPSTSTGSKEHVSTFPKYKQADCKQFNVNPGEVIYYPSHYWHQTLNLDRPCISMAGRRIDGNNAHEVYGELQQRCANPGPDITKQWPGAAPNLSKRMCKNIGKCYELWKDMFYRDLLPNVPKGAKGSKVTKEL